MVVPVVRAHVVAAPVGGAMDRVANVVRSIVDGMSDVVRTFLDVLSGRVRVLVERSVVLRIVVAWRRLAGGSGLAAVLKCESGRCETNGCARDGECEQRNTQVHCVGLLSLRWRRAIGV